MKFTIAQPIFKGLVSVLSSVTTEARIQCTDEGLETTCVDAAHVAMVGFKIPKDALTIEEWGTEDIGLDLEKINAFFKTTTPDEDITVEIGDKFILSSGHITKKMSPIDTSSMTTPKVPNLDLPVSVSMSMNNLQSAIKGVAGLGDAITMSVKDGSFKIVTEDDVSSAEYELRSTDEGVTINGDSAASTFPQDYVSIAVKAIPSSYNVSVGLGTDYPTKMDFTDGISTGWYLIAPRIEEDAVE